MSWLISKSAFLGEFTPGELANATNQGFFLLKNGNFVLLTFLSTSQADMEPEVFEVPSIEPSLLAFLHLSFLLHAVLSS